MTLLELTRILACVVMLLLLSGAGLTLLLVRAETGRWALLVAPFVGLAVTSAIAYSTSALGLSAIRSIWILGAVSLLLLAIGLRARYAALRAPRVAECAIALAALPALLLAVWPMLAIDRLLPIGDSNCDPISYSAVTDFLVHGSLRRPPEVERAHPTRVTIAVRMRTHERLGFEMIAAYADILAGEATAHRSFSAIAGVGAALGAVATGVLAAAGLGGGATAGVVAALLYAICAFPLWVVHGGYGPQALGSGLIPMTLWVGSRALRGGARQDLLLCGILVSAVAAIYSESLPYVAAPLGLIAIAEVWRERRTGHAWWRMLASLLAIAAVVLAFDPVAAVRAIDRVYVTVATPNRGNVDWHTDLRQVVGLLPFVPTAPGASMILWGPFLLLGGFVAIGFARLETGCRQLALAFAVPALLSIVWFVWRAFPYGEFKAWSIAAFLPFALLGVGIAASWEWRRDRRSARLGFLLAAIAATLPIAVQSARGTGAMVTRFAFSPALDDVSGWLSQIGRDEEVFVSPGKLSSVSGFWIAYVLREKRMHSDSGICYTAFGNERYSGQPWVLRHRSSELVLPPARSACVIAANEEYELLGTR